MGRPKKYTDKWIKRLAVKLLQYADNTPLPFKQEFARQNKFSSQRVSEFCKVIEFSEALKRFEDIQQYKIIVSAMIGKINPTMAIFTLKNVAGWRDVQEIKGSGFGSTTVNVNQNKVLVFKDADQNEIDRANDIHAEESTASNRIAEKV